MEIATPSLNMIAWSTTGSSIGVFQLDNQAARAPTPESDERKKEFI
jgi:hypothetical protein